MAHEHGGEFLCVDGHVAVDQQPFVKAIVNGSKQIQRDMEGSEAVLDPNGDIAFWHEVESGDFDEMMMCSNAGHKGSPWLPKAEFAADPTTPSKYDRYCKKCRSDAAFQRRLNEAEEEGRQLREKPGRPPKVDAKKFVP